MPSRRALALAAALLLKAPSCAQAPAPFPILQRSFHEALTPAQTQALGENPRLEDLVKVFTPDQRASVIRTLDELRAGTSDAVRLKELAHGYRLLSASKASIATGRSLNALEPGSSSGLAIEAEGHYQAGDYESARRSATDALALNPNDIPARNVLRMSQGRVRGAAVDQHPISAEGGSGNNDSSSQRTPALTTAKPRKISSDQVPSIIASGSPTPVNPRWPLVSGVILSLLGAAWAAKKKLDDENLTGPLSMFGIGVVLLGVSTALPPAGPALVLAGGQTIVLPLAQVTVGTAGSALTATGAMATIENSISYSKIPWKPNSTEQSSNMGASSNIKRPAAKNSELQKVIDKLFKTTDSGPGGTARAAREELRTGQPTKGKWHYKATQERLAWLRRVMRNEKLDAIDRATAEAIEADMQATLNMYK